MEKRSKRRLDFVADWRTEGDITMPVVKSKMVVTNYTKRYQNNLYLLAELPACARTLLDYLSEAMDESNVVTSNSLSRKDFIDFVNYVTHGKVIYADSTVKMSLSQLIKNKLLVQVSRGSMMVNPEYFFKGQEEDRMRLLKELYDKKFVIPSEEDLQEVPVMVPQIPQAPAALPPLGDDYESLSMSQKMLRLKALGYA
ncbi:MAG: replication/maintenance protein RepL [Algoriphagus sp.]|nr:replication/maintenance protein RepL [Algoriphagus sp.]